MADSESTPDRKSRGRPRKDDSPQKGDKESSSDEPKAKRGRGRPKGTAGKGRKKKATATRSSSSKRGRGRPPKSDKGGKDGDSGGGDDKDD